jgi:hypothetical protein
MSHENMDFSVKNSVRGECFLGGHFGYTILDCAKNDTPKPRFCVANV